MAVAYVMTANGVNDKTSKAAKAKQEAETLEAQAVAARLLHRLRLDQGAAPRRRRHGRADALRLGAPHPRALARDAGGQLAPDDAGVRAGRPERGRRPDGGPAAAAAPVGPSATLVGCTPKQSEVAKILVRLRSLHRVVDVELNESLREQGVQDVTVDSCGPLYKFDVTVTFAPADEAEAPRGSDSVPASLGGGS